MQRTQRSSGRRREGVPAEHVDVLVGERGEPGRVGAVNIAGGAQLAERGVGVAGVPQHDRVEDQAERAELANSTSQPTDSGMVGCRPDSGMVGRRPDSGMVGLRPGCGMVGRASPEGWTGLTGRNGRGGADLGFADTTEYPRSRRTGWPSLTVAS